MLVLNDQIYVHNTMTLTDPNWICSSISNLSEGHILLGTLEGNLIFDNQEFVLKELGSGTIHIQPNNYLDHGFLHEILGVIELFWFQEPKNWSSVHMTMSYRIGKKLKYEVVDWSREGF